MAARNSTPVLGVLCSGAGHGEGASSLATSGGLPTPNPSIGRWTVSVGYRYQPSSRHFVGDVEQPQRDRLNNEVTNIYHLLDVSVSRQISRRWSANFSIPFLFAERQFVQHVRSVGDITVGGQAWLFRPPTESGGNIALGFNLKLPTGQYNARYDRVDANGVVTRRSVDQSIQAGDGGTGFSLDIQAYKPIPLQSMVYLSGSYLFNPRNTNGVATGRRRAGEEIMSVADQYLFRAGVSRPVPKTRSFVATFGTRWEGVPAFDAIGGSEGFRRPGYAVALDPGFMYFRGAQVVSVNVPFPIRRDRTRSLTDIRNNTHGDAAFADYAIIVGFSRRF